MYQVASGRRRGDENPAMIDTEDRASRRKGKTGNAADSYVFDIRKFNSIPPKTLDKR